MCSSERWFVLSNGPPQPSLSDTVMSSRVVREAHGFHNVQGPEGSAWAGGTSPTIPVSGSSQTCSQGFHFWDLTTVFQSFITVWYDTIGAYERKCTVLIFVVMEEIEQESQRGLHLDYFNLFNVWLHRLKNKINKTPGEKTFWFEWEKQEEMPTPPLSRGDCPWGECATRHLPAWGPGGHAGASSAPCLKIKEFRGTVWNTQKICRVLLLFQTTSCSFLWIICTAVVSVFFRFQ